MADHSTDITRSRPPEPLSSGNRGSGLVEAAARLPSGDGWLLLGWTASAWAELERSDRLYAALSFGTVTGPAKTAFYPRSDVPDGATGFCAILSGPSPSNAQLLAVELPHLGLRLQVLPRERAPTAIELGTLCRRAIRGRFGRRDHPLLDSLPRAPYEGKDSIAELWPPVHFEIDQALRVPADGLALAGWLLDPSGSIVALRARGGGRSATLDPTRWIPIRRPDILKQVGAKYGVDNDRLGLLTFATGVAGRGAEPYLELETVHGEIGYRPIRVLELPALGAIKQVLSAPRPPGHRLQPAFDEVFGPMVEGLNANRLAGQRAASTQSFGVQHGAPEISLIIPLHGRIDFMEYQLALFSERPDPGVEILYILDDPNLEEDTRRLASSCWARFRLPFTLLCLSDNLGYAGANNVGLNHAGGEYVCLLNSDVFPIGGDGLSWLRPLAHQLNADASLGAIGPMLLYEDGTVQHQGMHYERLPEVGDWFFPLHTHKGKPPPQPGPVVEVKAITGACMVLRRDEVLAHGGLDEAYLIGDFEDAELCQRYKRAGQRCAVDTTRRLFHLERQSQGQGQPWRANATLYNAWRFNRRWAEQLNA